MSIEITVQGGTSKKLLTGGKYCPEDIVVTAEGGGSGGSVETLKGVISPDVPFVEGTVYFTNANLEMESIKLFGTEVNIEVARGSILVVAYSAGHEDAGSSTGVVLIGGGKGTYSYKLQADNFKLACTL